MKRSVSVSPHIKSAKKKKPARSAAKDSASFNVIKDMRDALNELYEEKNEDDQQTYSINDLFDIKPLTITIQKSSETSPNESSGISNDEDIKDIMSNKNIMTKNDEIIKTKNDISGLKRFASKRASQARQISSDIHKAIVLFQEVRKRPREPTMRHHTSKPQSTETVQNSAAASANFALMKNSTLSSASKIENKMKILAFQTSQVSYKMQLMKTEQSFLSAFTDSFTSSATAKASTLSFTKSLIISKTSLVIPLATSSKKVSTPSSITLQTITKVITSSSVKSTKTKVHTSFKSTNAEILSLTSTFSSFPTYAKDKEKMTGKSGDDGITGSKNEDQNIKKHQNEDITAIERSENIFKSSNINIITRRRDRNKPSASNDASRVNEISANVDITNILPEGMRRHRKTAASTSTTLLSNE